MDRITGISWRLAGKYRNQMCARHFVGGANWSRTLSLLQRIPQYTKQNGCLKQQQKPPSKTLFSTIQDGHAWQSWKTDEYHTSINCIKAINPCVPCCNISNKRFYSSGNKQFDSEAAFSFKEKLVRDKANFRSSTDDQLAEKEDSIGTNRSVGDSAKMLASDDPSNGEEFDSEGNQKDNLITVHVNDTDVKFELDTDLNERIGNVNQPSVFVRDFESRIALDDDKILDKTGKPTLDKANSGYKAWANDGSVSSESDSEVTSDLNSDSDSSDSESSSSDSGEDSDTSDDESEETVGTKVASDKDVPGDLEKEGFTSEEMIAHINNSTNMGHDNLVESEALLSDVDDDLVEDEFDIEAYKEDDEEIINGEEMKEKYGDIEELADLYADSNDPSAATEKDNNSDRLLTSAPSRHFDESGVISLVDMNDENKLTSRDWTVEEIEDFVNIASEDVEDVPWQPPVSLQRGTKGVFDLEELVDLMKSENLVDIVALKIPKEKHFGDYMLIGTARSVRHIKASSQNINWIYKQRKSESDKFVKQEGKNEDDGWMALDLGNIILHIFLEKERQLYDLESLWTVGPEFDDKCQEQEDPYALSYDDYPWLRDLEEEKNLRDQIGSTTDFQ